MKTPITIQKNTNSQDDLDFHFLRKTGIDYIEKIGSSLWTDYNSHDPGITMMEMLCYAITDLGQRIEMPITNLLASEENNKENMHKQFLSAINILPTKPVTALDYRNLFVHLKGVKNAWIKPHQQRVYINCDAHPAELSYTEFKETEKKHDPFILKGLNDIIIDLEEDVEDPEHIISRVKSIYHQNRNFCEDLVEVNVIEEHPIAICAYIDLKPNADEEYILALIHQAIDFYFSPSVYFYTLQQLFDRGYTTDQIFEGPVPFENACVSFADMKGGFVDIDELKAADLQKEVRLSDIIQLIMNIEGVNEIKDISIGHCGEDLGLEGDWNLCVEAWHKPVRCDKSTFNFTKGLLPIGVNQTKLQEYKDQLAAEERARQEVVITEDIEMPLGKYRSPESYTTIQNDFPETYGITNIGIPGKVTTAKRAKVNQLKGYLLFFDQILANYFKHVSKVKDLLSVDDSLKQFYVDDVILSEVEEMKIKQTFFSQPVEDLSGIEDILTSAGDYEKDLLDIMNNIKGEDTTDSSFYERRNQLLDHLIARFAERFSDYAFLMKTLFGENEQTNKDVLRAKLDFLIDYKKISCERGMGFNYCEPKISEEDNGIWDTLNVAGVQKRIARLLGIQDYSRRDLVSEFLEVYDETDAVDDDMKEYRWRIKTSDKVLLSSSKHYHHMGDAYEELFLAYHLAKNSENYDFDTTKTGKKVYFNLVDRRYKKGDERYVISRRIAYKLKKDTALAEAERDELITLIRELSIDEGMYMIEHILLRPDTMNKVQFGSEQEFQPDAARKDFMPSCLDRDCKTCVPVDPYSFRVTIILPGWTERFGNKDFRNFAEQLIREELPAHVLAKICWVGQPKSLVPDSENDLLNIQKKYKLFLQQITCKNQITSEAKLLKRRKSINDLVRCLGDANTIYHSGRLHDCDNDATEESGTKIILGRTNIGNLN